MIMLTTLQDEDPMSHHNLVRKFIPMREGMKISGKKANPCISRH